LKLHILSDLHLEFTDFTPPSTRADVVILAGDIALGCDGLHWAATRFPQQSVVYVPGNHEYYGVEFTSMLSDLRQTARELGIFLLEGDGVALEEPQGGGLVRFLGGTLWTDFRLFGESRRGICLDIASQKLNDFRRIKDGAQPLLARQTAHWHAQHVQWLKDQLQVPFSGKTVVVTHHLPSARSVADRYKNDLLSACFASELDHLFGPMALWVHGHTHDCVDYEVGGTRVVCNPRGYTHPYAWPENPHFNSALVIEV